MPTAKYKHWIIEYKDGSIGTYWSQTPKTRHQVEDELYKNSGEKGYKRAVQLFPSMIQS